MVTPIPSSIVVIPFPFSDLSDSKLRPALVFADAGRGDWVLCQITSNPYSDPTAIRVTNGVVSLGIRKSKTIVFSMVTTHEVIHGK